jgi:predicted transcriptional regulator
MEDIPSAYLQARKQALDELAERLAEDDYLIAEKAIDLFLDYLESSW